MGVLCSASICKLLEQLKTLQHMFILLQQLLSNPTLRYATCLIWSLLSILSISHPCDPCPARQIINFDQVKNVQLTEKSSEDFRLSFVSMCRGRK